MSEFSLGATNEISSDGPSNCATWIHLAGLPQSFRLWLAFPRLIQIGWLSIVHWNGFPAAEVH